MGLRKSDLGTEADEVVGLFFFVENGCVVGNLCGGIITGCSNNADIISSGTSYAYTIGGVVGMMQGTITNCANTGNLSGGGAFSDSNDSTWFGVVGGVVGYLSGEMNYCYSAGNNTISSSGDIIKGGVIGNIYGSTVHDTFYLDTSATYGINTNGVQPPNISGATAKTATELKTKSTFSGWNLDDTWQLLSGNYLSHKRAPVDLVATRGNGTIALNWGPVTGATGYKVYIGTTTASYDATPAATIVGTTTSATLTGLDNANEYYIAIKTTDADGNSPYSYEVKSNVFVMTSQAVPTFSTQGAVDFGSTVTLSSEGAEHIYYTTNGDEPTILSTEYIGPVTINAPMIIKAIATRTNYYDSAVGSAGFMQAATVDLTNIGLSGSPANYTFMGNTYTYNGVSVASGVSSITVIPTGTGTITVDGVEVETTKSSGAIALTPGVVKKIVVSVGEEGKSTKTYEINVTRAVPTESFPTPPVPTAPAPTEPAPTAPTSIAPAPTAPAPTAPVSIAPAPTQTVQEDTVAVKKENSKSCSIKKITTLKSVVIKGGKITASVSNATKQVTLKIKPSEFATWKLYSDKACKKKMNSNLKLKIGKNKMYIKVTAGNKKTKKVYMLTITRKAAPKKN